MAVASALLSAAGLALVAQAPASAVTSASAAPAQAAAAVQRPAASQRPAGTKTASTSGAHAAASKTTKSSLRSPAKTKGSSSFHLPADVKAVCGTPTKTRAACMTLLRTNVKAHKGRFSGDTTPSGYGPSDLQSAYDLPSATAGAGETVAVVDAYDDPDAEADLQTYRAQYGLPVCDTANGCFEKVNQEGQASPLPPPAGTNGWDVEESLDIDMVSAICPNCHILLVEANSNDNTDLYTAEDEAVTLGAKFVSNSWSSSESSSETQDDQYFNHPGVAITASAGDDGYGVGYPAASQYVTAVGGTTLTQDASTARGWTETAWGSASGGEGTGSGCSAYEPKPTWQTDTGCANRTVADVSADADPNTGVAMYDSYSEGGWIEVGGTSVASPVIASTYALAGTPAAGTDPSSYPYLNPSSGLNDVTSGANGTCTPAYLCTAGPGYDGPTGLGTPDGISAFTPVTYGTLSGTVTDAATGKPVTDGTVTADGRTATITSGGRYTLDLAPGSYSVTATGFGHVTRAITGITITGGQATRRTITLTASPDVTLSGTVVDGSGHKWPLFAEVSVAGTPLAPVYTSPYNGHYSIAVPAQAAYTLDVSAVYPGYTPAAAPVTVGNSAASKNIKVSVDASACDAPGYALSSGTCAATRGGLVTGVVTDGNTAAAVNGATITSKADPSETATSAATGDPDISGGFYWLFSPATGLQKFTAAAGGYTAATASADVAANAAVQQDWTLQAGRLTMAPSSATVTEPFGATKNVKVTFRNTGTAPVHATLGAQNGGFTPILTDSREHADTRATGSGWTSIANYPTPIYFNSVAYDSQTGDVYSIGGSTDGNPTDLTTSGYVYSPATGQWTPIAAAPTAVRSAFVAFVDGRLYLAGGETGSYVTSSGVYAYTPGSNSWTQVANLPVTLAQGATAVLNGQMYVVGGCTSVPQGYWECPNSPSAYASRVAYRYAPVTNTWTKISNYPVPVETEACAGIDGELACAGGGDTSATYLYNPVDNTWSEGADMPSYDGDMAYAGANGELQVIGGTGDQGTQVGNLASVWQYDPATNAWSSLPDLPADAVSQFAGGSCGLFYIGGQVDGSTLDSAVTLPGYGQCDGAGGLEWLSESRSSFVVAPGKSATVEVNLNSADVNQPGSYQAMLYASTDTPYPIQVTSLTMNVKPSSAMHEVSGTVTAARGKPINDATVAITSGSAAGRRDTAAAGRRGNSAQVTPAVKTDPSGHWEWWLAAGHSRVQVSAAKDGYQPQATTVITSSTPATVNFALKPDPSALPYTQTAAAASRTAHTAARRAHRGRANVSATARGHKRDGRTRGSSTGLPSDVRAVCGTPSKGHAACMALLRTNVRAHKGLLAQDQAPSGYGPSDLQSAYSLPSATAGSGETVAVVDVGGDPTAEADLGVYRAQYGLPACTTANGCFEKVNQKGRQGNYPPTSGDWPVEESLDIDMVSAICPNCHILLVEADNDTMASLGAGVDEAVTLGAKFVSNSYGTSGELSGETRYDHYYNHPGIVITASAGDVGYGVHYPAASQYVTSVGGTTLTQDPGTTRGWTETTWGSSNGGEGTGSGCSAYEPKPSWQTDIGCGKRTDNDVSAVADPNTGVAVYDTTGEGGWLVVGGTSASSPIIASTYALAGTPTAGTYPSSYPYVNVTGTLNDVTSGADGTCTPAYLCTAGPGYDGPTGLGTPNGVTAFTPATYGTLSGRITDAATGNPIAGAAVTVDNRSATTASNGDYSLDLAPGTYTAAATDYGHVVTTTTGVQITSGQTTTQNIALTAAPNVTLSGTVTDGSGHKWPLYAEITVAGTPLAPVYTNPGTGKYSITIASQASYTLDVAPVYPGYTTATSTVQVGTGNATQNVTVAADTSTCTAPGYAWPDGPGDTQFTGWTGSTPQDGWTDTANAGGNGDTWVFGNNPTSETTDPAPPGDSGDYAIADSNHYSSGTLDTSLVSPVINLSGVSAPQIGFDTYYRGYSGQTADVDLSLDGGQTWTTVWQQTTATVQGPVTIPIPQAAGQADVQVRFHYTGSYGWWWSLGNEFIGSPACALVHGGLVIGVVKDANTGDPVNGATITETGKNGGTGTSAATGDPAIPGGFYWLFSPAGTRTLTATDRTYGAATATIDAKANTVTSQDWSLQAGHLTVTPGSASATVALGASATVKLTYTNDGTAPLQVSLGKQDDGFTPATGSSGTRKANAIRATSGWASIASYPIPIEDNADAYDPRDGDLYSIGGLTGTGFGAMSTTAASYVYDPATGAWDPIANAPQAMYGAQAAFIDGTMYLVGGATWPGSTAVKPTPVPTVYSYSPASNIWSQVASLPQALVLSGLAVLDGQLYVVGGCYGPLGTGAIASCGPDTSNQYTTQAVYRYNPGNNEWTQLANYPTAIGDEACAGIDGEIVCAGGTGINTVGSPSSETYLYDPASNTWSQGADMPYPSWGMSYSGANGQLQVVGGWRPIPDALGGLGDPIDQAEQYNPATNVWTALPKLANAMGQAGGSCGMYVVGGGGGAIGGAGQSAQVLPGYDQCDGAGDTGWVSPDQSGFELAPGASVTVKVRLDSAKVTQPGTYQASLYATTNTPYPVQVTDVTMTVNPPAGWSLLSGTVTDASGNPIAGATVQIDTSASSVKSGQADDTLITGADGTYQWWIDPSADDPLQVIAAQDGYIQQVTQVQQPSTSLDFALNPFPSVPY